MTTYRLATRDKLLATCAIMHSGHDPLVLHASSAVMIRGQLCMATGMLPMSSGRACREVESDLVDTFWILCEDVSCGMPNETHQMTGLAVGMSTAFSYGPANYILPR